jgi:hypothetical protein
MPFSTEQLGYAAKHTIDYFLKNDPVDQINVARPLIKMLTEGKQEYAGGLQYVVETLRYQNDSNFQSYFGASQVSYNRKRTLSQAKFSYGGFHDGFGLDEDELAQNGITMTDDKSATPTDAERVQLVNVLTDNQETLKLGFQEGMDLMLHRDGSQDALAIPGLDALIALDPTASASIGTINQNTNTWWRNQFSLNISTASADAFISELERVWRECTRYGGTMPDKLLCGGDFLDAFRKAATNTVNRQIVISQKGGTGLDPSITGCYFHGVELIWDPVFDVLDTLDAPTVHWAKRCYFINSKFLKLRPIKGHWMVSRKPPRVYDRYVHYFALTAKAALTTGKRNAHAVVSIA